MSNLPQCDRDVYDHGVGVFVTHSIPAGHIEEWVKKVAKESGQRVDWHFMGGRAVVRTVGDVAKVKEAIVKLLPEHNELQRREHVKTFEGLGLGNHPFKPSYMFTEADETDGAEKVEGTGLQADADGRLTRG